MESIKAGWLGFPIAYIFAMCCDWFFVSKLAKGFAFKYLVKPDSSVLRKVISVSCCMVVPMVIIMSLYGAVEVSIEMGNFSNLLMMWLTNIPVSYTHLVIGKSDYSFLGGQTVARELLEKEPDLDAIICATDRLAFGTYKILHEYKKEIPEEVSVAAFGGYDESALLTPELTTLKFDSYGMGYLGAETILKMIAGDPVSKKQIVGYEFIDGGSVR